MHYLTTRLNNETIISFYTEREVVLFGVEAKIHDSEAAVQEDLRSHRTFGDRLNLIREDIRHEDYTGSLTIRLTTDEDARVIPGHIRIDIDIQTSHRTCEVDALRTVLDEVVDHRSNDELRAVLDSREDLRMVTTNVPRPNRLTLAMRLEAARQRLMIRRW